VKRALFSEAYLADLDTADQRIFAVPKAPYQANNNEFGAPKNNENEHQEDGGGWRMVGACRPGLFSSR
jgi:hypothetical protein